jgi:hypothetical protein
MRMLGLIVAEINKSRSSSLRSKAAAYFDFTSPENPAMASKLNAQPTTAWK